MALDNQSGKMQNNRAMPYNFKMCEVFNEAWQRVYGAKGTYWLAVLFYILMAIALGIVGSIIVFILKGAAEFADPHSLSVALVGDIAELILFPLVIGIAYLGVRRVANLPIAASMIFRSYSKYFHLLGAFIVIFLIALVIIIASNFIAGLIVGAFGSLDTAPTWAYCLVSAILIIAGIAVFYLTCGFLMFAPLLILEKRMGIFSALGASLAGFTQHWFKLIIIHLVMGILVMLSAIPFGIGLIWTIPMALNLTGVLYRTIFGVTETQ